MLNSLKLILVLGVLFYDGLGEILGLLKETASALKNINFNKCKICKNKIYNNKLYSKLKVIYELNRTGNVCLDCFVKLNGLDDLLGYFENLILCPECKAFAKINKINNYYSISCTNCDRKEYGFYLSDCVNNWLTND